MKKLLAILLAIVALFSVLSVGMLAAADNDNIFGIDKEDEKPLYIIIYKEYQKDDKVMYMPPPTYSYEGPRYLTITTDAPTAIGKEFQYWVDDDGNTYVGICAVPDDRGWSKGSELPNVSRVTDSLIIKYYYYTMLDSYGEDLARSRGFGSNSKKIKGERRERSNE